MRELLSLTWVVACLWLQWAGGWAKIAATYAAAGVLYAAAFAVEAMAWLLQLERFNAWCEAQRARQAEQRKITARRKPLPKRDTRGGVPRA